MDVYKKYEFRKRKGIKRPPSRANRDVITTFHHSSTGIFTNKTRQNNRTNVPP